MATTAVEALAKLNLLQDWLVAEAQSSATPSLLLSCSSCTFHSKSWWWMKSEIRSCIWLWAIFLLWHWPSSDHHSEQTGRFSHCQQWWIRNFERHRRTSVYQWSLLISFELIQWHVWGTCHFASGTEEIVSLTKLRHSSKPEDCWRLSLERTQLARSDSATEVRLVSVGFKAREERH